MLWEYAVTLLSFICVLLFSVVCTKQMNTDEGNPCQGIGKYILLDICTYIFILGLNYWTFILSFFASPLIDIYCYLSTGSELNWWTLLLYSSWSIFIYMCITTYHTIFPHPIWNRFIQWVWSCYWWLNVLHLQHLNVITKPCNINNQYLQHFTIHCKIISTQIYFYHI